MWLLLHKACSDSLLAPQAPEQMLVPENTCWVGEQPMKGMPHTPHTKYRSSKIGYFIGVSDVGMQFKVHLLSNTLGF